MPTFNIYIVNGLETFNYALNSVAMLFNSGALFRQTVLMGAMFALALGALAYSFKWIGSSLIKSHTWIEHAIVMVLVVGFAMVPTRVVVQDLYGNRAVTVVDNVPLVFSFPASVFSSLSYEIFTVMDTTVQDVSGSYMSVSQEGFATPLKLLFAMREGLEKTASGFHGSLQHYLRDCSINSNINAQGWASSTDLLDYILENGRDNGITQTLISTQGADLSYPMPTSCLQAKDRLRTYGNAMLLDTPNSPLNKLIRLNMGEDKQTSAGTPFSLADVTRAHQILGAAGQSAQQFMVTALIRNAVHDTFSCLSDRYNESAFASCVQIQNDALEAWKVSATTSASIAQKTVFAAMSVMQVMFFLFGPIVLLYGLLAGAAVLRLLIAYLMFGMWVFSWMPFIAVINGYIQWTIVSKLNGLSYAGLSHANYTTVMYDVLSTNLALASDLLAVVPMITLAVLLGSPFALAGVANRLNAQQHLDVGSAAPRTLENDAPVRTNATLVGAQNVGQTSADHVDYKYDLSQGATDRINSANTTSQTSMLNMVRSQGDLVASMRTDSSGWSGQNSSALASVMTTQELASESQDVGASFAAEKGYSNEDVRNAQSAMEMALGLHKSGAGAGMSMSDADVEILRGNLTAGARDIFDEKLQHIYSSAQSQTATINDLMTVTSGSVGAETKQKFDSFRSDVSTADSAVATYQDIRERNIGFTQGASLNQTQMGSMLGSGTSNAQHALGLIDSNWRHLYEQNPTRAEALYQTNENMLSANGKSVVPELDAQAKMLAIEKMNPGFTSQVSSMLIGGESPSYGHEDNKGVGSAAVGLQAGSGGLGAGVRGANTGGLPAFEGMRSSAAQDAAVAGVASRSGGAINDGHMEGIVNEQNERAKPFISGQPVLDERGNEVEVAPMDRLLNKPGERDNAAARTIQEHYTDKHDLGRADPSMKQEIQQDRLDAVTGPKAAQRGGTSGGWEESEKE